MYKFSIKIRFSSLKLRLHQTIHTKPLSATKQRAFGVRISKLSKEAGLSFITWN